MVKWVKFSGGFCLSGRLVTKRSQFGHKSCPDFWSELVSYCIISSLDMVEAAGVEPDIGTENTQVTDTENA